MTFTTRILSLTIIVCTMLTALLPGPTAQAQSSAADAERYFKVEYGPQTIARRGFALEGYVYSTHSYRVGGMRLRVQVLDGDGQILKEGFGWVPGDVPAGGRAYFLISVPERGAGYKVNVVSYYLVSRDAP